MWGKWDTLYSLQQMVFVGEDCGSQVKEDKGSLSPTPRLTKILPPRFVFMTPRKTGAPPKNNFLQASTSNVSRWKVQPARVPDRHRPGCENVRLMKIIPVSFRMHVSNAGERRNLSPLKLCFSMMRPSLMLSNRRILMTCQRHCGWLIALG